MAEKKEKKAAKTAEEVKETTAETAESAELSTLNEQLETLTKEKDELQNRFLRTAAEYDNYRRRTGEEMTRKFNDGKADALMKLLPVMDSVRMAMAGVPGGDDPVYKGMQLIAKQLSDTLAALGVTEIPTDIPFDPNLHNAVMHIDDETKGEGEIVDVFAVGYQMGDRVLRHTMVRVAN